MQDKFFWVSQSKGLDDTGEVARKTGRFTQLDEQPAGNQLCQDAVQGVGVESELQQ
jgi:hypothetical protein